MLEFQRPAPRVVQPRRQAAVHTEVTHSCVTLLLALATIIQLVTCRPISEALIQHSTDTEKVAYICNLVMNLLEETWLGIDNCCFLIYGL